VKFSGSQHIEELVELGCDPSFFNKFSKDNPLFTPPRTPFPKGSSKIKSVSLLHRILILLWLLSMLHANKIKYSELYQTEFMHALISRSGFKLSFEYLKARSKESFPLLASFPSLIL
jgi:hypothetical protein